MDKILNYKPIRHLKVTEEQVNRIQEEIVHYLNEKGALSINELNAFESLYVMECNESDINQCLSDFQDKFNLFMTKLEAINELVRKGEVIPIQYVGDESAQNKGIVRIKYTIHKGDVSATVRNWVSGDTEWFIPVLPYTSLILKPSLCN